MNHEFEPLDEYERTLIESIEHDEFTMEPLSPEEMKRFKQIAANTGRKDQRMNIRMSSADMQKLKARALQEGIPYQTLVSSILHKFVNNRLHESV